MGWFNRKTPVADSSDTSTSPHPPKAASHGETIVHLSLYRLGNYEDNLRIVRARHKGLLSGVITVSRTPSGKYAGQPFAIISVDSLPIGELPAQHREKNAEGYKAAFNPDRAIVDVIVFAQGDDVPTAFLRLPAIK